jgi:mRNA interferase HigB
MQVLNQKVLDRYWRKHANAKAWLRGWLNVVGSDECRWQTIHDVRRAYPAADGGVKVGSGGSVTVFDVGGNKHRLIASIVYAKGIVVVHEVMPHSEYTKDLWKARY